MTRTFTHSIALGLLLSFAAPVSAALTPAETKMAATVDAEYERTVGLLERLVNQNSGSMNLEGVEIVGRMMRAELEPLGFKVDWVPMAAAKRAVAEGWDMGAPEPERQFFYMPYEHSEDADDQTLAVALLTERLGSDPEMALHARAHQAVIARFGRFPTRNAALGRASTPEEEGYLADGGYMAVVAALKSSHAASA